MSRFILAEAEDDIDHLLQATVAEPLEVALKSKKLSAKKFLLTYAQCPEDPEHVFESIDKRRKIARAVGCIELHADGNPHIHIALEFEKKLTTPNFRFFDYSYNDECDVYHPNISPAESWPKCINYCRGKEKTLVQLFQWRCTFQEALDTATAASKAKANLFAKARNCSDVEEWYQWCYENSVSSQFCRDVWAITLRAPFVQNIDAARPLNADPPRSYDPRFGEMALPDSFAKCVVICGPTGIGKTTWARNHLVGRFGCGLQVGDIDDLKLLNANHKFILFDEIRFNGDPDTGKGRWPLHVQIAIADTEYGRTIRCRHSNAVIPQDMPKVFTCTEYLPFTYDGQIERRIHIINMYQDRGVPDLWPPIPGPRFGQ